MVLIGSNAVADSDYVPLLSTRLTFNSTITVLSVDVLLIDNGELESTEYFFGFLSLPNNSDYRVTLDPNVTQAEIIDDDSKCVSLGIKLSRLSKIMHL